MLVALETVYEVLRSERPLEPARSLLRGIVDDLKAECAKKDIQRHPAAEWLEKTQSVLGGVPTPASSEYGQPLANLRLLEQLVKDEVPRGEDNRLAASLILDAYAYRCQPGRPAAIEGRKLLARFMSFAAAARVEERQGLGAVRAVIREEVSRLGVGATINQSSPLDLETLRGIVASEVRTGVTAAGRDRWSAEPLSKMVAEFLVEEGEKTVGSKHRKDVPRRLSAFSSFVGEDKPVRDVSRKDIENYRDVLDQLPSQFKLHFKTDDMRVAIEKNAQRKRPIKIIGPANIDLKWIGPVARFFDWLVGQEKIEKNPTAGVRSKQQDGEADRPPLSGPIGMLV